MLFNSIEFLYFLPIVFILYWFVFNKNLNLQNLMILVASYFFYASWDYRFLFLLIFSTLLDYYTGIKMNDASDKRGKRFWFWLSICVNVGFLGIFKYYNFFISSFADFVSVFGFTPDMWTLKVILPVGISFYTFHGLSYVIDIYNGKIQPERNFISYSVFVSYFPLLVAGPIERATHLLPQIKVKRQFDSHQAIQGVELILWGFFKKVVIADTMAGIVSQVYGDSASYGASALIIATVAFSFQIYGDFSGYSDIAIGTSKLFGIELLRNFNFPYLSRNIAEFWKRWHISLSTWFRDYLYIPLGGSKVSKFLSIRNVFIIFIVSGFWHGANWTFIIWGAIHAILFVPSFVMGSNRKFQNDIVAESQPLPKVSDMLHVLLTFISVSLAWVFFRSVSVTEAITILVDMFTGVEGRQLLFQNNQILIFAISFGVFFIMSTIVLYRKNGLLKPTTVSLFCTSIILLTLITLFGEFSEQTFIYFQF